MNKDLENLFLNLGEAQGCPTLNVDWLWVVCGPRCGTV